MEVEPLSQKLSEKKVEALWISNPNPMIGKVFRKKQLKRLVDNFPQVLFILDETCIDFLDDGFSMMVEAQTRNNLIVIRSFSKLYGLAGLRAGFASGKVKILNKIKKNDLTFPLTGLTTYLIKIVLKNQDFFSQIKDKIKKHKLTLEEVLAKDPEIVLNRSITNCLFFAHRRKNAYKALLNFGVISLPLDEQAGIQEKGFIRITVPSSKNLYQKLHSALVKFVNLGLK